jgi:hypothetical protein
MADAVMRVLETAANSLVVEVGEGLERIAERHRRAAQRERVGERTHRRDRRHGAQQQ